MKRVRGVARGIGMIELLAVIAMGALLVAGLAAMVESTVQESRRQQSADQQRELSTATMRYLRDDRLELEALTAAGPYALAPAVLVGKGYLPPQYVDLNPYQQHSCVLVKRSGADLEALVVTEGGLPMPSADAAETGAMAGPGGGHISLAPGASVAMAYGADGWQLAPAALAVFTGRNCSGEAAAPGHLASALHLPANGPDGTDMAFMSRSVQGEEEGNRMTTSLEMGSAAVVTTGSACTEAALAVNERRDVVTCTGGKWTRSSRWKDPVGTMEQLRATHDEVGDVRVVKGLWRAFVREQTDWRPLAVDEAGDLLIPGSLFAGNGQINGAVQVDGDMHTNAALKVGHDMVVNHNVEVGRQVDSHHMEASGWTASHTYGFMKRSARAGQPCNLPGQRTGPGDTSRPLDTVGTALRDEAGITLYCQKPDYLYRYHNRTFKP